MISKRSFLSIMIFVINFFYYYMILYYGNKVTGLGAVDKSCEDGDNVEYRSVLFEVKYTIRSFPTNTETTRKWKFKSNRVTLSNVCYLFF